MMGTYDPWPSMQYHRGPVEQALRNEISELKIRVAQLEGKQVSRYETRLYVNDDWKSTFKSSDKIRLVEHKHGVDVYRDRDRVLFARN